MAKQITNIEVFIASPGDVAAERDVVDEVVQEINRILMRQSGIHLEVIRWETHAHPGKGSDAQDVINSQMPTTCDILLAIFWHRVGTPTSRAVSGTLEEVRCAHERWKLDNSSVKIMLYFKTENPPLSAIDPDQLKLLRKLKRDMQQDGFLTYDFPSTEQFRGLVRSHLHQVALEVGPHHSAMNAHSRGEGHALAEKATIEVVAEVVARRESEEDELGFLELAERGTQSLACITSTFVVLAESIEALGVKVEATVPGLVDAGASRDLNLIKKSLIPASTALTQFSDNCDKELSGLNAAIDVAMDDMDQVINMALDYPDGCTALQELRPVLESTAYKISNVREGAMIPFLASVERVPRLTSQLRRARRRAGASVSNLVDTLAAFEQRIAASRDLTSRLLETATMAGEA